MDDPLIAWNLEEQQRAPALHVSHTFATSESCEASK